jgi:hypothetical protein
MLQRVVGRVVGAEFRREVPQNSYADGVRHLVILMNHRRTQEGIGVSGLEGRCGFSMVGYSLAIIAATASQSERLASRCTRE